jgi:hypothetical protein
VRSSYAENNYRKIIEAILVKECPRIIVECGILDGYSFFTFADFAKKYNGLVYGIDLFDDYEYNHPNFDNLMKICEESYLDTAFLYKKDAIKAAYMFVRNRIDLLHLDISNTGDRLSKLFDVWFDKVRPGGTILFEGGSEERDNIEWMQSCGERKIRTFIEEELDIKYEVDYYVIEAFPSMTVCKKKEIR